MGNFISSFGKGIFRAIFARVPLPFIAIVLLMGLSSWGTIDIARKNPEIFGLVKGSSILQKEQADLIAQVGRLITLPKDETPTVATVTDLNKVKDQTFFRNAANGDKVLIYTNAKKAILYRPSENRIVEVGVLNINQQGTDVTAGETPAPTATPKIVPVQTP